jgi:hypothetical protein
MGKEDGVRILREACFGPRPRYTFMHTEYRPITQPKIIYSRSQSYEVLERWRMLVNCGCENDISQAEQSNSNPPLILSSTIPRYRVLVHGVHIHNN